MEDLQRDPELNPEMADEPPPPVNKQPDQVDPFEKPVGKGLFALIKWAVMLPLYFLAKITIPDCRKEAWANSFILTFIMVRIGFTIFLKIYIYIFNPQHFFFRQSYGFQHTLI